MQEAMMDKYIGFDTVGNPSKMTWIYRTVKKNDRVDAARQASLPAIEQTSTADLIVLLLYAEIVELLPVCIMSFL